MGTREEFRQYILEEKTFKDDDLFDAHKQWIPEYKSMTKALPCFGRAFDYTSSSTGIQM